jgi:uncharacterized protein (TIGR02001 family)
MKMLKTAISATAIMFGATAMAVEVSGNIALGSEYFFRGVDQSGGSAVSGGFDATFDNGVYVGTWASSVNFSGGQELDYYVGYGSSLSEEVTYDIGYVSYGYPQGSSTEDFSELYGSVSFSDATVGFAHSEDYYASTGKSTYLYVDYGLPLSENFSLGLHYGTMNADDPMWEADDYSLTLSTEAAGLNFDLSWVDASEDSTDQVVFADNELVLSVSKSM